jgi:putative ABC transport system substrate-binding protein
VRRREFLLLGAGTLLVSKPVLGARKLPRIGFIGPGSQVMHQALLDAFRDGLEALGWTANRDVVIVDRWAEGDAERLPEIAAKLVGSGVDILVTPGTAAALAARKVTATTPIVLVGVTDPVGVGILDSLARPSGNATGLSLRSSKLTVKRFQLLQELVPGLRRVAVMVRDDPGLEQELAEIRDDANRLGLDVVKFTVTTGKSFELTFLWLRNGRFDGLYLESGPLGPAKRAELIALAAKARIPAIYPLGVFAVAGGLVSLAPDCNDLFRRAAIFVDKILNGRKPADLPVEQPTKFRIVINLSAARALDLHIPQSVLSRADEIIE